MLGTRGGGAKRLDSAGAEATSPLHGQPVSGRKPVTTRVGIGDPGPQPSSYRGRCPAVFHGFLSAPLQIQLRSRRCSHPFLTYRGVLAVQAHVVEEGQLDLQEAPALALRAGTLGVEAEEGGGHLVGGGERPPDGVEHVDVGGGVGTRGTPDGALIDDDHLAASSAPGRSSPEGVDELGYQRALARPGDAGDARQHALRYPDR